MTLFYRFVEQLWLEYLNRRSRRQNGGHVRLNGRFVLGFTLYYSTLSDYIPRTICYNIK
jgi:hypothetical protein